MVAFNRVVLSGTLASGAESWSTSCAVIGTGADPISTPSGLSVWAAGIGDLLGLNLTAEMKNGLGASGALTEIRTYFYASTTAPASAVGISSEAIAGTTGISRPTSVAAVLSLSTGLAGRRYRGRMYWPALANTITTTGRFSSTVTQNLADGAVALLNSITLATPSPTDYDIGVVSRVGDFVTPVTAVRVGDVPDSMRSRRDALDELYVTESL